LLGSRNGFAVPGYPLRNAPVDLLRKSPAFTIVAVLTPALGIGTNTAIYLPLDQALLRSLPVNEPSPACKVNAKLSEITKTNRYIRSLVSSTASLHLWAKYVSQT